MIVSDIPETVRRGLTHAGPRMRKVLEWLDAHPGEDSITMGDHIKPLVAKGDVESRAILSVLAMFNQHPWLHRRMTFHALADTQEWAERNGVNPEPIGDW